MPDSTINFTELRVQIAAGRERLAALTAYSFPQAKALEKAGIDWILVGDSGGMVELGYKNTRPVSLSQMLSMTEAVRRGAPKTHIVGDLPFGTYEESPSQAVATAIAFAKAGDVDAVKLEGGARVAPQVEAIASSGISVMGHLGLTPQGVSSASPYRVVGRRVNEVRDLIEDAQALKRAGATSILLEALPPEVTKLVVDAVDITFFGIGSGPHTHGQLLILHDIVGLYPNFRPKFAKNFATDVLANPELLRLLQSSDNTVIDLVEYAARAYAGNVREGVFPLADHCYLISQEDLEVVRAHLGNRDRH
ncbi:3-methyl-2-oxobutanoate hydroxymethyltransferase [Candidatus Nanopelagicales bacterium]|nr:3-methyl-2-oxobutanoate hydroxymethyltransferase [Candidatus Nanopelagicales bacterium]